MRWFRLIILCIFLDFRCWRPKSQIKTDQSCDYSASGLENSSLFAEVSETSFTSEKTVTVAVTHKRFPRKWQSRSEVTLVWSSVSHQTVSTYCYLQYVREMPSNTMFAVTERLMVKMSTSKQRNFTSTLSVSWKSFVSDHHSNCFLSCNSCFTHNLQTSCCFPNY